MRRLALILMVVAPLAAAGCGGGGGGAGTGPEPSLIEVTPEAGPGSRRGGETVRPVGCPAGIAGCRSTSGRIVFVERVDPDGDGDAHFVVLDSQGITLPGLTAIDVSKGLRPHPLPGVGELIAAAGPVQTGSHGQSQIHAITVHVARR